jgi:hypothetical protein
MSGLRHPMTACSSFLSDDGGRRHGILEYPRKEEENGQNYSAEKIR